jgi:5-methyltetrahydrofolate--homocysteine methyltransferase
MSAFATRADRLEALEREARRRVLLLDGAMGTMLQRHKFAEAAFRTPALADWHKSVRGNNDLLNLSQPDVVRSVHTAYLNAGSDIVETNTFSATTIAQADYDLQAYADAIAEAGAKLAREACDAVETPDRPRIVAGAFGPTNKTLSISPDVNDPGKRDVTFDEVAETYRAQADAMASWCDIFLIETIFDTLNAKAAIKALLDRQGETGEHIPILISGTITDASGRTLSGQTTEAFWNAVRHAKPWAVGLNCALGAAEMRQYVATFSRIADTRVLAYPNAGLPNELGEYDEQPHQTAGHLGGWAGDGLLNIVGGCCGTTPEHIAAIAAAVHGVAPRAVPTRPVAMRLSGLEPFEVA